MKMFYAHLELLISLYLKRNYKYFIEQINRFIKIKNNLNVYNTINNQNQPIINLNNAHCSLYYSININKDLNNNNTDIYNKNNKYMKTFYVNKNIVNNMENINYILNTENKSNNKTIYVPKNKTSKLKKIKANKAKNKNSNNIRKSSPIKEMSIDLKKMNLNANKTNNNLKNEKNKLKFANSKKNIYKKPIDNNKTETVKDDVKDDEIKNDEFEFDFVIENDELGEYGKIFIFNEGTEFEDKEIEYFISAGTYIVKNISGYQGQFAIQRDEVVVNDDGWEEPGEVKEVYIIKPGDEEGYYLDINLNGTLAFKKIR